MRRRSRRRDERGAVFPVTILLMGIITMMLSLVIDIGGDRIVRRDMQSMADVVALDVVRRLDGSPAGAYAGFDANAPSATLLAEAKNESLERQDGVITEPDSLTIRLAVADRDSGTFVRWASATDIPNAVRVWTTGSSAFRILPSTPRSTAIERSALAMIGDPIACISVGATFAEVEEQGALDTLLGKLLQNQGVDRLTVLDPYALASLDMEIPLMDLAAELNVGTVEEILTANVSAQDFVLAISEVLPPANSNNPSPKALLDAIVNGLPDTVGFTPGDILDLDTGGGTGTTLVINTFTLVQAVIMVANQNHFVELKTNPQIVVPGLTKIQVFAQVVDPPKIACGPVGTSAKAAQIGVRVIAEVTAISGDVKAVDIDPLEVTVSGASAEITDVKCTAGSSSVSVRARSSVGTVKLNLGAEIALKLGVLPTLTVVDLGIAAPPSATAIAIGESSYDMTFDFPTDDLPPGQTQPPGASFPNLGLSTGQVQVTGLPLQSLLSGLLSGTIRPLLGVIDPLVGEVLRQVLGNLGVSLGTVRVQPTARPSCNEPFLIG